MDHEYGSPEEVAQWLNQSQPINYDIEEDLRIRLRHLSRGSLEVAERILGETHAFRSSAIGLLDKMSQTEGYDSDAFYFVADDKVARWSPVARNLLGMALDGVPWSFPGMQMVRGASSGELFRKSKREAAVCFYWGCDKMIDTNEIMLRSWVERDYMWCGGHWRGEAYLDGVPADLPCTWPGCDQDAVGKWVADFLCRGHLPIAENPREPKVVYTDHGAINIDGSIVPKASV